MSERPENPEQMLLRADKSKATRRRAALTVVLCLLLVLLCTATGLFLVGKRNEKVARAAAEQLAAEQAEQERLAAEEAARLAAEQAEAAAEAERLAAAQAEREAAAAAIRAAQEREAAKDAVRYGSRIGTVWVEGTNVNCDLYWGDSMSIMDAGAGSRAENGCVLPGENGTVFIGAHTGSYFYDLQSVQVGAIIHLATDWGDFRYRVTEMKVIGETQVELCRWGDTQPNCILYTCYPFGILTPTTQRYLVYAEPVETDENGVVPVLDG